MPYRVLVICVFILLACNKEKAPDFIKTAGEEKVEYRAMANFTKINIKDEFDVEIIQDTFNGIELKFGSNLLPKVETRIDKNTLLLENKNKFNWLRKLGFRIKAKVYTKQLKFIELDGDGTVFNQDTLYADTIEMIHSGTNNINMLLKANWVLFRASNVGNILLKGSCGILSGTVEETAIFDGRDILAEDAYFYHFSLSNSHIRAKKLYGLNMFGKGDLYYYQEALRNFTKLETGSGRVKRAF